MANNDKESGDYRMLTEVGVMGMCGFSVETTEKKVDKEELFGNKKDSNDKK